MLVDFRLRAEHVVARELAQSLCATEENCRRGGFGQAQEQGQECGTGQEQDLPA